MRMITTSSTQSSPRKVTGSRPVITVTASGLGYLAIGGRIATATGSGLIVGGIGTQMNISAGQPITMADGSILAEPDGAGFPATSGLRPGSPGGRVTKTLGGLLSPRKRTFPCVWGSHHGRIRIMALDRLLIVLSAILIGRRLATRSMSCLRLRTCRSSARPRM